jgi:predicted small secreted protein
VRRPGGRLRRCLGAGASLLSSLVLAAAPVLAADPTASPAGGDVRTSPTAPGLVGDPLFAVAGVVVIGLVALGATLLYVRLTARP